MAKRKRTETQQEIDADYDMSRDYLANPPPPPPQKALLDKLETYDDMKSVVKMMMVMLSVLEAVVEKGIEPLSAAVSGAGKSGNGFCNSIAKTPARPVAAKPPAPGCNELIEALARSELESVIFGANLGSKPILNRTILNNDFSADFD